MFSLKTFAPNLHSHIWIRNKNPTLWFPSLMSDILHPLDHQHFVILNRISTDFLLPFLLSVGSLSLFKGTNSISSFSFKVIFSPSLCLCSSCCHDTNILKWLFFHINHFLNLNYWFSKCVLSKNRKFVLIFSQHVSDNSLSQFNQNVWNFSCWTFI